MTRVYQGELECATCNHYEAEHLGNGVYKGIWNRCMYKSCKCEKFTPPETPEYTINKDGSVTYL